MSLDADLLEAHRVYDLERLVVLYEQAADAADDPNQEGFFLTHAHVFALELGHPNAVHLRQRLVDAGREVPLPPPNPRKG